MVFETEKLKISCEDNMALMARYPDKYFDLAIVDPPYGIGFGEYVRTNKDSNGVRYLNKKYHNSEWDSVIPSEEYFKELFRVSRNQIIWGGNYFNLGPTKEFIFWYKRNPVKNFSDGEFAWTSFTGTAKCFDFRYYGNLQGNSKADNKIHPTQKPVELYSYLLQVYHNQIISGGGGGILDTHLGSGSIAIACHDAGIRLTASEINENYYNDSIKRLKNHMAQTKLF